MAWLAIPVATLNARYNARGVVAGVVWTGAIMVAVTLGIHPQVIAHQPARLLVPLSLLAGVTLLTGALARSDLKYRAAAAIDSLTGLFNRRALTQHADELLDPHSPIAVVIGDLDHFKQINDRHGHAVGDAILRQIADTLRTTLRTVDDIIPLRRRANFVMLLPAANEDGALATAERLRVAVAGCATIRRSRLTMSFGVGLGDGGQAGLDELLSAADRALHQAKTEGRAPRLREHRVRQDTAPRPDTRCRPTGCGREARRRRRRRDPPRRRATPAGAFAAARRMFLDCRRVDMTRPRSGARDSAPRCAAGAVTREQLLGEVLVSLSHGHCSRRQTEPSRPPRRRADPRGLPRVCA